MHLPERPRHRRLFAEHGDRCHPGAVTRSGRSDRSDASVAVMTAASRTVQSGSCSNLPTSASPTGAPRRPSARIEAARTRGIGVGGLRMQQPQDVCASECADKFDSGCANLLIVVGQCAQCRRAVHPECRAGEAL